MAVCVREVLTVSNDGHAGCRCSTFVYHPIIPQPLRNLSQCGFYSYREFQVHILFILGLHTF